jgi:CrcB protein
MGDRSFQIIGSYFWIAIGGALGSVARFWMNGVISRYWETFPMGTLVINILGSFAIGLFASVTAPDGRIFVPPLGRQFFMIGVCGGFTTFSSFSLQTFQLLQDAQWAKAGLNILFSIVLCILGVWAGYALGTSINSAKPH